MTRFVAELDKDILDSLHKIGFRTNLGYDAYDGTGIVTIVTIKKSIYV